MVSRGLNKVPIGRPGQADFLILLSHFLTSLVQWARGQVCHPLTKSLAKTSKKCSWESQNVKVVCPNDKLEFYPFSSLVSALYKETVNRQVSSKTAEKKWRCSSAFKKTFQYVQQELSNHGCF